MGRFNSGERGGFERGGGRSFGGRSGGRGGFGRDRDSGRGERRPVEMHNAVCIKCGKRCQVPFKPTGAKPVYCSECFRESEGANNNSSGSRNNERGAQGSGASSEQMKQINTKLDKILAILSELELDTDDEDLEEIDEE